MPKFLVDVPIMFHVAVDATDTAEAAAVGCGLVVGRLAPTELWPASASINACRSAPAPADARTLTYVCPSCGVSHDKRDFGPGWLRCPNCGEQSCPVVT